MPFLFKCTHTQKAYDPQTNDDEHEDAKGMAGDEEVSA